MSDLTKIKEILREFDGDNNALIAILQRAQAHYGYLPEDVIAEISRARLIPPAEILGVASFYAQFRLSPVGKHLILLCKGTACHVNGADGIEAAVSEELGIADGETTSDGLFTLNTVACLGCCSLSPVMMIDNETYGSLTPQKAKEILRSCRQ
ncbi:MAG: NADH-quinone oxidoreductase subunit NuoE [Clostridia bacterium]|nr:NADH-quinone oxidoreductase subunit NuoE [Clostridia bacterium]